MECVQCVPGVVIRPLSFFGGERKDDKMIEFCGYLSGKAEKYFLNASRKLGQKIILITMLLFLPIVVGYYLTQRDLLIILFYIILSVFCFLATYIPQNKKEKISVTPQKVYINGDYITCIAEKYTETRFINDVKTVLDHGEFYEFKFPFGKLSDKFICQKNLITKGTLGEFEQLFADKIKRQKDRG